MLTVRGSYGSVVPVRPRRRLTAVAASLAFVPAPPVIQYVQGAGPSGSQSADATAVADAATSTVYYQSPMDKFTRGHETGHIFDHEILTDGDRVYFQKLLHAPAGDWRQGTGTQGGAHSPSEWFADYYGAAATHLDPAKRTVSSYAPIGPKRLKRFEAALERLGKRQNLKPYQ